MEHNRELQQYTLALADREEALHHEHNLLSRIMETTPAGITVVDREGRIIFANTYAEQRLGLKQNAITQRTYNAPEWRITDFEGNPFPDDLLPFRQVMRTGESVYNVRHAIETPDGRRVFLSINAAPLTDASGRLDGMVATIDDITDQQWAAEVLRRKAETQTQLLEAARQLTASLDVTEVLTRIATSARMILKAESCTIYSLGTDGTTLIPVIAIAPQNKALILSTPLDVHHSFTGQAVKTRGGVIFNDASSNPLRQSLEGVQGIENERVLAVPFITDHTVLGAMCLSRASVLFTEEDLTLAETFATYAATALKNAQSHLELEREIAERNQVEADLREANSRIQATLHALPDLLFEVDDEGRIFDFYAPRPGLLYRPPTEFLDKTVSEVLPEDAAKTINQAIAQAAEQGHCHGTVYSLKTSAGVGWFELSIAAKGNASAPNRRFIALVRDITERKRAEQVQTALYRISEAAQTTSNLDELYTIIHAIISDLMRTQNFSIALYDPVADQLTAAYHADEFEPRWPPQPPGKSLMAYVLRTGRALLALPEIVALLEKTGEAVHTGHPVVDWLGVPLTTTSGIIGVMAVRTYTEETRLTPHDANVLRFVSNQVAMAIERKQAEEQIQKHIAETEALADLSRLLAEAGQNFQAILDTVVRHTAETIGDGCGIYLLSEDRQCVHMAAFYHPDPAVIRFMHQLIPDRQPVHEGVTGRVLQPGQALLLTEITTEQMQALLPPEYWADLDRQGIASLLVVPLHAQGQTIGMLALVRSPGGRPYTVATQTFVQELANRAALALLNARLFEEAQRRLRQLQALHAIDSTIAASTNLNMTLEIVISQVIAQLRVDAADVLLLNPHTQLLSYAAGRGFRTAALRHTCLRLGEGLAGRAALENQTIYVTNLREVTPPFARVPLLLGEDFVSYYGTPLVAKGQVRGVLEIFHRSPLSPNDEWLSLLQSLAGQAAVALDNASLFEELQRSNIELMQAYDATIEGWSRALDLRDRETEGHTQRVAEMTVQLARLVGVRDADLVHIRRGALLHDIGKMGIPDQILLKVGPLTDEEMAIMHKHPQYAYEMLSPIAYLRPALDIPYCHHEKWDGSGYPRGLKGTEIPLAARLFTVVDVWDALTSNRTYRAAWSPDTVRAHIIANSGKHFDPEIAAVFLDLAT